MSWPSAPVTVKVPATSANLGPGFDSFGLALTLHDTVEARVTATGVDVQVTGMGGDTAGAGERHLVIRAMRAAFDVMGAQPGGIAISCRNAVPHGFGLGSSAAAIVAGVLAARALAGDDGLAVLSDSGVLTLATELEGHPDNVAACLLGGLTIAWRAGAGQAGALRAGALLAGAWQSGEGVAVARLEPLAGLTPVVCVPTAPLATEVARKVLPATIPHADAAANSARAALLVTALTSRPDLLLAGTEDFLHQRYRADSMPATAALIAELRVTGIAAVVSGAGPSVLALPADEAQAMTVARLAAGTDRGGGWQVMRLPVDSDGAQLV